MAQLTMFSKLHPYEYIIDSSSIFTQKPNDAHRRNVYPSLWKNIDSFIMEQKIVICSEIKEEISDKEIVKRLSELNCIVLDTDDEIQENVIRVVKEYPKLIKFDNGKSAGSSGDAFLVATAMKYGLTVITEEKKGVTNRIPYVCNAMGVSCVNIDELCIAEGWQF